MIYNIPISRYLTQRQRQVSPTRGAALQAAIDAAKPGQTIYIHPGTYEEEVVIPATLPNLTLWAVGGRGSVAIVAPDDSDGFALTNHAADVTLINIGCEGEGTGGGLVNTGRRLRAYGCKFEGGDYACTMSLGTVAQIGAGTRGKGDDCLLEDCELAWAGSMGLRLLSSDYGAVTQLELKGGKVHNCDKGISESSVSADVAFRDLMVHDVTFGRLEDGTEPTNYIDLNGDNANTGIVTRCSFPSDLDGGKNLVSTALIWAANYHSDGISDGQPS